ncbi:MAG: PEP-utilizing enzyme [Candidatus Woesearchaeota archaeon]
MILDKIKSRKWRKLWDFHFSIWFLDRVIQTHLKYPERLGYENRDTVHVYSNGSEQAYFSEQEIDALKSKRKEKLLSVSYMNKHENDARKSMKSIEKIPDDLFLYSEMLEELLSYYRASRPEIFELIEDEIDKKEIRELIGRYGHLRLEIKNAWINAEKGAIPLKKEFAKKLRISIEKMESLTNEEIKSLLSGGISKLDALETAKERDKLCVFGIVEGEKFLFVAKEAENLIPYIKEEIKETNVITGKSANPGRVRGIIRVVPQLNHEEMMKAAKNLKKGEILVTGMTQPDIFHACKKAKAIITDEGGITSHAAIVSRELNIPCIIGTKIATRVLKDGDLVEVDAEKGIVKKL